MVHYRLVERVRAGRQGRSIPGDPNSWARRKLLPSFCFRFYSFFLFCLSLWCLVWARGIADFRFPSVVFDRPELRGAPRSLTAIGSSVSFAQGLGPRGLPFDVVQRHLKRRRRL